ncbi:MAG TPA: DUF3040 domain-containing protein [Amycolatopsis sp.]|nr:DUF3040 domain-containing protein [Amycolatopsis sp.]
MKLNDEEARRLTELERALRESDPRLDRRLSRMRGDGFSSMRVILVLLAGIALGVALVAVGDLLKVPVCLVAGIILTATAPALAVVWWARRYYCRYCAGKWPAPSGSCPRCARPINA